jgi:hypothetical protein
MRRYETPPEAMDATYRLYRFIRIANVLQRAKDLDSPASFAMRSRNDYNSIVGRIAWEGKPVKCVQDPLAVTGTCISSSNGWAEFQKTWIVSNSRNVDCDQREQPP